MTLSNSIGIAPGSCCLTSKLIFVLTLSNSIGIAPGCCYLTSKLIFVLTLSNSIGLAPFSSKKELLAHYQILQPYAKLSLNPIDNYYVFILFKLCVDIPSVKLTKNPTKIKEHQRL